jgi:radical SAM superfamily enzyme YgiQ (UPF0313 family)
MINVYLADLANNLIEIDNKSVPIGVGYVGAYCLEKFASDINLKIFRVLEPLMQEIEKSSPDIVGLSCYDWNYNLSRKVAQWIKTIHPRCIIVMGGASIDRSPAENKKFLEENSFIDAVVFGDGEYAFASIVKSRLDMINEGNPPEKIRATPLDGVRAITDGKIVMGAETDIVPDLNLLRLLISVVY